MSEKKESGKRPPTRPSIKVSIPIAIYLRRKERMRRAALLDKQRKLLNKMKEEHKRSQISTSEKQNNASGNDPKPNVSDVKDNEQPVGYTPRPQRPRRAEPLDVNNNIS